MNNMRRETLRHAVRYFYDLQALRIQMGNRAGPQGEGSEAELDDEKHKEFLGSISTDMNALEKKALKEVKRLLKGVPIWEKWLKDEVKGVGPTLGGFIVANFDIERSDTPSKMWAYAGLAVDNTTGRAVRRKRGERANFNPVVKSKLIEVLGKCLIKAKNETYYKIYVDRKHRRKCQLVKCMACDGSGVAKFVAIEEEQGVPSAVDAPKKKRRAKKAPEGVVKPCMNCEGSGTGPWGTSDAHRELDARRYMVKMFLVDLYKQWRSLEGLPVRPSYHEERLGHVHSGGGQEAVPRKTTTRSLRAV